MSATLLTELALASDAGLPDFFLGRLASLVARQMSAASPTERKVLGEAIFSIYLDCLDLGLGEQAQALVEPLRTSAAPGGPLAA